MGGIPLVRVSNQAMYRLLEHVPLRGTGNVLEREKIK